jgi:Holliday junction resolvase RusA-like endonuclease
MRVQFSLHMEPRGQGRARVGKIGNFARMYKASVDTEHESTLRALCAPFRFRDEQGVVLTMDRPVAVKIVAVMPRSAALSKLSTRTGLPLLNPARRWHTSKPDADNIAKAVLDAMRDWWTDDRVVVRVSCDKVTAALFEAPHYEIAVEALEENP